MVYLINKKAMASNFEMIFPSFFGIIALVIWFAQCHFREQKSMSGAVSQRSSVESIHPPNTERLLMLDALQKKILWLSSYIVHHANHLRLNPDKLKVGGHQASCASVVSLMTALYFDVLQPEDRVAVKPHASPVFHAIQYLFGRQSKENLERFRALGGAQAYPSRTKDVDDVDISTGSVGLGVAFTVLLSLVQDYLRLKQFKKAGEPDGRMIAIVGDAELDEGSVFESLFEGWKHDLRNVWWIIDYNRQSLDLVIEEQLVERIHQMFRLVDWNVIVLKYGQKLREAFTRPGGDVLKDWIDNCPNPLYSALVFRGGSVWREQLLKDIGNAAGIPALLDEYDDSTLHELMTNLGGHDLPTLLNAFHGIQDDRPTAVIAYTIKGWGLPLAGHKDNHAGMMSPQQLSQFQKSMKVPVGYEWDRYAGLEVPAERLQQFVKSVPFATDAVRKHDCQKIAIPRETSLPISKELSTQAAFGRLLNLIAQREDDFSNRIVTVSPDVASSTNLGPWITKRGIFHRQHRRNFFAEQQLKSKQEWSSGPQGQHVELGITETDLFLYLGAAGLSSELFGQRLLPIGTLYDPFIRRGLDALNYACYQDARFMFVGTPSGVSLAPEGGAHQSVITPLIGMSHPGLTYFEPSYADELQELFYWGFEHLQRMNGGSVYLRLSTRKIPQAERELTSQLREDIVSGGYWLSLPEKDSKRCLVCMGAVIPEVLVAHEEIAKSRPAPGILVVTSPSMLLQGWQESRGSANAKRTAKSHVEQLLDSVPVGAELVTILDGHPLTLSWMGSIDGMRVRPLGVKAFGESGCLSEVYHKHGLDTESILKMLSYP